MKTRQLLRAVLAIALAGMWTTAKAENAVTPLWLRDVQVSPDGTQVAFCYKGDIYKVPAGGGEAQRLTTQDSYECSPVWSPDGSQIAFASDRHGNMDIFLMPAGGGAAARLTFNSVAEEPQAFSPDGKWVLFKAQIQDPAESVMFPSGRLSELYKVPVGGGRTLQVLATPAEMISFAPDGKGFYYQDCKGYEDEWRKHHTSSITRDVWFYDIAAGRHTNLTLRPGEDRNPAVSPDGKTLYFLSERDGGSMNVYSCEAKGGGTKADTPKAVTNFKTHPVRFLSVARDGLLCFTWNGEIYTQKAGGKAQKLSISLTRDDEPAIRDLSFSSGARQAVVSSDGKQIAFVVRGEVFVTTSEYATTRRISETAGAEAEPDFAPDGRTIVYASERNGNWQLFKASIVRDDDLNFANATLIKEESIFPELPALKLEGRGYMSGNPRWVMDGKAILFQSERYGMRSHASWGSQDGGFSYEWSPDGKWFVLSYIANRRDPYQDQGIVSAEGGEIHPTDT